MPRRVIRLDARQQRIADRLSELVGPGAAAFFRDAVALIGDPEPFATVTHLVSHLLRETQGMILDVLAPPQKRPQRRPRRAAATDDAPGGGADEEGGDYRARVKGVLVRLEISDTTAAGQSWLRLADRRQEKGLQRRAHRGHLDDVHPLDDEYRTLWSEVQTVFDAVLDAYQAKFPEMLKEVDDLLASQPSRARAKRLQSRMPNTPLVRDRFFENAGPNWMSPLRAEGVFDQPAVSADDRLYRWCQSTYLKRMAAVPSVQPQVAEILTALEPVPLLRLHMDLLDAARSLPPELSAGWVEKESIWISQQESLLGYFAERLAEFAAQLAQVGACASALRLSRALLDLRPDRPAPAGFFRMRLAPLFDHYYYTRVVDVIAPLVRGCSWQALVLGVEILGPAVRRSARDPSGIEDHSNSWCERIGELGEHDDHVAATLVRLIRDAARACVKADPTTLQLVSARLRHGGSAIFRRIELGLLSWHAAAPHSRVADVLMERDLFARSSTWPEYSVLLRTHWDNLDPAQRAAILSWIAEGPSSR